MCLLSSVAANFSTMSAMGKVPQTSSHSLCVYIIYMYLEHDTGPWPAGAAYTTCDNISCVVRCACERSNSLLTLSTPTMSRRS